MFLFSNTSEMQKNQCIAAAGCRSNRWGTCDMSKTRCDPECSCIIGRRVKMTDVPEIYLYTYPKVEKKMLSDK